MAIILPSLDRDMTEPKLNPRAIVYSLMTCFELPRDLAVADNLLSFQTGFCSPTITWQDGQGRRLQFENFFGRQKAA